MFGRRLATECKGTACERKVAAAKIGAKGIKSVSNGYGDTQEAARTLAGATILQIVPALREEPVARTALNVAHALLQSGARA